MRPLALAFFLLSASASANADVVYPSPVARASSSARLSSVRLVASDAPQVDATRVEREARVSLMRSQRRINRCLAGVDLRRDPLRSGARTLTGRLVFTRSTRPRLHVDRVRGFSRTARSCVEEALRGLAVHTRPRGTVEIRFTYRIE